MDKFIKRSAALLASAAALLFANVMFGSDELSGSFSVSAETAAEQSITQQQDSNTDTDKQGESSQPDKQEASKTEDGDSEQTYVYGISAAETSIDKALIVWEDSDRFELYSVYAAKEGEEPKLANSSGKKFDQRFFDKIIKEAIMETNESNCSSC